MKKVSIYHPEFRADLDNYTNSLLQYLSKTVDIPYGTIMDAYAQFQNVATKHSKTVDDSNNKSRSEKYLEYFAINGVEYLIDPDSMEVYTYNKQKPQLIGIYNADTETISLFP